MGKLLLFGIMIGFTSALAPGPVNVELVRRSFTRGPRFGLAFGMGAVTVDVLFLLLAMTGLKPVIQQLSDTNKAVMWLVSAVILAALAYRALRARPADVAFLTNAMSNSGADNGKNGSAAASIQPSLWKNYTLGFVLTATSPTIFAWYASLIATAAPYVAASKHHILPLVAIVGVACTVWVVTVVTICGLFHRSLNAKVLVVMERVLGGVLLVLVAFALWEGLSLLLN